MTYIVSKEVDEDWKVGAVLRASHPILFNALLEIFDNKIKGKGKKL